ncbi:MAG: 2-oxoacid:ferredoxin oxidoreductase subunit beta [Magnetovibrionaceae bacterium]
MNEITPPKALTAKDFATDQEVRWCPGCGDYAILKGVQKTLADLQARPENTVFVSGIGCSSRFPYYMATYGFHTIHGRAPAFATGIKLANPELDVWLITGDGDGLSIGGNHLMHAIRRNVDMNILLFNNEIYGLTKGQFSPTSRAGTRTPSSPVGSLDQPVTPLRLALGASARFVARAIDTDQKKLPDVLKAAAAHKGASFVEIFQNCIVYNDGVFNDFTEKAAAAERQLWVKHGEPLVFGASSDKGIRLNRDTLELEIVTIGEDGVTLDDVLVHDQTNRVIAGLLADLSGPDVPVALGVLYCSPEPTFEAAVSGHVAAGVAKRPEGGLAAVLRKGHTWEVADS